MTDFDAMSIDELAAFKRERKAVVDAIYDDEIRPANEAQDRKIAAGHVDEAASQVIARATAEGKSPDQLALEWLGEPLRTGAPDDPALGHNTQARLYFGLPRLGREPEGWNLTTAILEISARIREGY